MAIDISVVIPTYREDQNALRQNISYMKEQTAYKAGRMEIVIADFYEYIEDERPDSQWSWLKSENNKNVKKANVDRRGIAYGRHTGIMASNEESKAIVNFDADGYLDPIEAVDMLTRPILEGRAHLTCCDNVLDTRGLTTEQIKSISIITNVLDGLNRMQQNYLVGPVLEAGMSFSKEAYTFVGGFSDVKQYEGAILGAKIMHEYTAINKIHIPQVTAVLSPRRSLAAMQYGILNAYGDYLQQNFR